MNDAGWRGLAQGDGLTAESLQRRARGVLAETFNQIHTVGNAVLVDGTVYYTAIPLLAGQIINNLTVFVQAAGVGVTLSKLGLYDRNVNRVAVTADLGTAWQSVGNKTSAVLAPYAVQLSDLYYFAVIAKTATTIPSLTRGSSGLIADGAAIGSGLKLFGSQTGQTDLPATGVITASIAATQLALWGMAS